MTTIIDASLSRLWPATRAEWAEVFKQRESIAGKDRRHAFLFHLDWNSEPHLIEAARSAGRNPTLTEREWAQAVLLLEGYLRSRWFGRTMPTDRSLPLALVRKLSKVVVDAVALLSGATDAQRLTEAKATLIEFALGTMRQRARFGSGPRAGQMIIGDPDSYYIWFFAEFGIMAIDQRIDQAMWRELVPTLVLAGLFYSGRFKVKRSLRTYSLPGAALTDPTRKSQLEDRFRKLEAAHPGNLGNLLRFAMKSVATSYH